MHAVNWQTVSSKIMWEFVRVNQEPPVIQCWAVFHYNIVQLIVNVHRERFAKLAFVRQFVHRIVNVSPINFAYKAFVKQHVTITQLVANSNFAKTIFVHKRFDAELMMIVHSTNIVSSIRMVDQNVRMRVKDVVSAVETPIVQLVIMKLCVHVNKALLMMVKVDVDELNVKKTMNVAQTNSVKRISANWHARVGNHVVKKQFVPLKIIDRFAIVNLATVEIHTNNVMRWIIAVTHLADQELCAQITKALSIALAVMDTLVIHTMKVVD